MESVQNGSCPSDTLELLGRAQAGEHVARDRFLARCHRRALRIARVRMGRLVRSQVESVDIAQQVALVVLRKLEGFEPQGRSSVSGWLRTIVERQIGDVQERLRCQRRDVRRQVPIHAGSAAGTDLEYELRTEQPPPADIVIRDEARGAVRGALRSLPRDERELIRARMYEGRDWASIARDFGCPSPDAARMRFATACHRVAQFLSLHRAACRTKRAKLESR